MMIVAVLNRDRSLRFVNLAMDSFCASTLFVDGWGWEREHCLVDMVREELLGPVLKQT
jgi:hypothetical protein